MKKVFGIVAVAVFSLGLFSCEAETNVEETEALFETLKVDENAVDGDETVDNGRT
ncbi:hypothetical protein ACOKFD_04360 [Flagellimonas sp. S174]|uniref:hypothetical protein n=1 Tax=Flagellimonas sp. S174 TaxID=3410790 RepID=UPI003BF4D6FA